MTRPRMTWSQITWPQMTWPCITWLPVTWTQMTRPQLTSHQRKCPGRNILSSHQFKFLVSGLQWACDFFKHIIHGIVSNFHPLHQKRTFSSECFTEHRQHCVVSSKEIRGGDQLRKVCLLNRNSCLISMLITKYIGYVKSKRPELIKTSQDECIKEQFLNC